MENHEKMLKMDESWTEKFCKNLMKEAKKIQKVEQKSP